MDKDFTKFMNSQSAFDVLWDKAKPSNGAMIAHIDAVVSYDTEIKSLNKTVFTSEITLDNSNNFLGGIIDLPTKDFDENTYHGRFHAKFQDFSYNGNTFVIRGKSNEQKNYDKYTVTLLDIRFQ